ncbi:MAG: hypothetical protein QXF26_04795 [Candidatus Bathyarchaeia archaeon]
MRSLEYLAFLVAKYNMSPIDFAEGLLTVLDKGEAICGPLRIECRQNTQENAVFLVTLGDVVVSQFSLARKFFESFESAKSRFVDMCNRIKQRGGYSLNPMVQMKIRDLRVGARNVRLVAKVLDKSPSKRVISRNGKELTLSNITVSDETGSITLPLWNEQIDLVAKGDTIKIENASVRRYRGERQLNIGYKRGRISILEPTKIAPTAAPRR